MTFCDETDGYCPGRTVTIETRHRVFHVCPEHAHAIRRFARIEARCLKRAARGARP